MVTKVNIIYLEMDSLFYLNKYRRDLVYNKKRKYRKRRQKRGDLMVESQYWKNLQSFLMMSRNLTKQARINKKVKYRL